MDWRQASSLGPRLSPGRCGLVRSMLSQDNGGRSQGSIKTLPHISIEAFQFGETAENDELTGVASRLWSASLVMRRHGFVEDLAKDKGGKWSCRLLYVERKELSHSPTPRVV